MKKFLSLTLAAALAALCMAGCGSQQSTDGSASSDSSASTAASSDAKVIKIGGIGPLTGAAAIYGNAAKAGAEIAVEEINKKGDIKFELKYEDDENDAEKAVNAYNKLKDWGMQISLGCVTTKPCIAVGSEVYSDRIFAITPSASSTDVIDGKDLRQASGRTSRNQDTVSRQFRKIP